MRSAFKYFSIINCAIPSLAVASAALLSPTAYAANIFTEDFESGALDPRATVSTIGTFNAAPGIQNITNFGSSEAFGFGLSTCSANCYGNYVTNFTIDFGEPTFVSSLSFSEMELYDNWGSNGLVYADNVHVTTEGTDFGRLPYNDRTPDTTYRTHTFQINSTITTLTLQVVDITRLSEIYIDDVVVSSVTEPSTEATLSIGLLTIALAAWRRERKSATEDA